LVGELEHQHLRVLIANERSDRLDYVAGVVTGLGHEVVARSIDVSEVGPMTARELPDVALVGLGQSGEIVHQASCPVIALLETDDHAFVNEAAKRGVFAYITDTNPSQLQDQLDIVLRRFAEFQGLEGAFGRRAVIERAKGILMERHGTGEKQAFEMLHSQSRSANRKLVEIAAAVVEGHSLLPGQAKVTP
jgi:AmiR/NasT family two-component response regulator